MRNASRETRRAKTARESPPPARDFFVWDVPVPTDHHSVRVQEQPREQVIRTHRRRVASLWHLQPP